MGTSICVTGRSRTRAIRHLGRPYDCGREVKEREIVCGLPVKPSGDAAASLQLVDASLNYIPRLVSLWVVLRGPLPGRLRGDHGSRAHLLDQVDDLLAIIRPVGENPLRLHALQQRRSLRSVVPMTAGEQEAQWFPFRVDAEVDLGTQSSSGTPQSLTAGPLFQSPPADARARSCCPASDTRSWGRPAAS